MAILSKVTSRHIFIGAGFAFLAACWFSIGFRHGDEHFQIFEFAGRLLGWNTDADMAWEYHNRMRPTLQPCITAIGIKLMDAIGLSNPFTQAFVFRLMGAALLFYALYQFLKAIGKHKEPLPVFFMYFFCLTPYIAARYSSEGIATGMLMLVLARLYAASTPKHFLIAGLFSGLAFAFRFQLAFALVGVAIWYVLSKKINWREVLAYLVGFLLVFACSILIDRFFYGEWVVAPYQYFYQNIILNKASNYGVDPWWYYLWLLPRLGMWLPGFMALAAIMYYSVRKPKDLSTWVLWLFLIGHMMVAHKESRFMFLIAMLVPYMVYDSFVMINLKVVKKILLLVMITANMLLFMPSTFTAASDEISLLRFLEKKYSPTEFTLYFDGQSNPYEDFGLRNNFYGKKHPVFIDQALFNDTIPVKPAVWVSFSCNESDKMIGHYQLKKLYQVYPNWVTDYFNINNWTKRASILTVYELIEKK